MARNMGTSYNNRISLRLNDEQYHFVIECAEILGVNPSDYIRMAINSGMVALKQKNVTLNVNDMFEAEEVGTHENVKTDINNQL